MTKKLISPLLADVICKVNRQQALLSNEELVYIVYLERIANEEVRRAVRRHYEDSKKLI
jgi:hypothetical protein